MFKKLLKISVSCCVLFTSTNSFSIPPVTGQPVIVQHLGKLEWPQDNASIKPSLTQLAANDINDLHGEASCDLIISTPGSYHMALRDAMYGRADLGHTGLLEPHGRLAKFELSICWSTSQAVVIDQINAEKLQFKNIKISGRPSLVMAPAGEMNILVANGQVEESTRQPLLSSQGNVMLIRADKADVIHNICDLDGNIRVVTPNPVLEPALFVDASTTIFNVAEQNLYRCDAITLFNSIFSQDPEAFDLSVFDNPYNIDGVLSVFGRGSTPQGHGARWVASSRIMHRDLPYALCHNEADAGIISYHQALYIQQTLVRTGCSLEIVPLGGTVSEPRPLPGNRVDTLQIAKVNGRYPLRVKYARDLIYNFLTSSPVWEQILNDHGMIK